MSGLGGKAAVVKGKGTEPFSLGIDGKV